MSLGGLRVTGRVVAIGGVLSENAASFFREGSCLSLLVGTGSKGVGVTVGGASEVGGARGGVSSTSSTSS